jgi:hypothetical protein
MSKELNDFRRIPTEEAFSVPEQMDAMRKVLAEASDYHPDLYLWNITLGGGVIHDRLLDLDGERIEIMDEAGIDMQLLSLTSTGVQMMDRDTRSGDTRAATRVWQASLHRTRQALPPRSSVPFRN